VTYYTILCYEDLNLTVYDDDYVVLQISLLFIIWIPVLACYDQILGHFVRSSTRSSNAEGSFFLFSLGEGEGGAGYWVSTSSLEGIQEFQESDFCIVMSGMVTCGGVVDMGSCLPA
jgi:hypothetical protein